MESQVEYTPAAGLKEAFPSGRRLGRNKEPKHLWLVKQPS